VADLAERFLADRAAKKKAGTVAEYRRFLARDVLPSLGALKVAAATRTQVAKLHLAMRDRPYLANRALAVLGAMFRFAELHGLRPPHTNPCTGIEPYPERARERFLSAEEFAALGAALAQAEREGLPAPPKLRARRRVRRPRSTGPRRPTRRGRQTRSQSPHSGSCSCGLARVRGALAPLGRLGRGTGIATLPDTKPARASGTSAPRRWPPSPPAPARGQPARVPRAQAGDHLRELKRLWEAGPARGRDCRPSPARPAALARERRRGRRAIAPHHGRVLGHREVSTTQRYAHLGADPLRRAADDVSARISAALGYDPNRLPDPAAGAAG
jgi:hypothetical protein